MSNHLMYVSPAGNDKWSGRYDHPLPDGTDGPVATLSGARDNIRRMKRDGTWAGAMEVLIRGGVYRLAEPVEFGAEDSGPVRYAAYPGETPVFDGGVRIDNWTERQLNSRTVWIADLPEVRNGKWYFRQLFVNGRRMPRSRYPKQGYFTIEDVPGFSLEGTKENGLFAGSDQFHYADGNIRPWRNLQDVDLIVHHYWVEERMPIERVDEVSRLVVSSRRSVFGMRDDEARTFAHYYVENVWEEMSEPGEWYLDRSEGKLYYLPLPGQKLDQTEAVAPRIECFLRLHGDPAAGLPVEDLIFCGLHFRHSDWHLPPGGDPENIAGIPGMDKQDLASSPQAAYWLPGAISLYGARQCAFLNCKLTHIGFYGIDLRHGCKEIRLVGNEIRDIGAGGIKISGASAYGPASGPESMRTGQHLITDNHIHQGGKVFASACGIVVRHAYANLIAHNHIHDLYYTGISCGWEWTYRDNVTKDNIIEKNHIHDLGFGLTNDLGGIYLLGVQPGTVVRGNLIHHVTKKNYGGWGIYTDEASSHILVENNIVHHTHSQCFHQHYGRENIVRNNIFAFGQEGLASLTRIEQHNAMTYEKNIFLTDGSPVYLGKGENALQRRAFRSDGNLFWDIGGKPIVHANFSKDEAARMIGLESFDMDQFRAMRYDLHSAVANPGFRDPLNGDFTMSEDSPAIAHGFQPIELSDVGPRTSVAI